MPSPRSVTGFLEGGFNKQQDGGGRMLPASGSVLVRVGNLLRVERMAEEGDTARNSNHDARATVMPCTTVTLSLCDRHVQARTTTTSPRTDNNNTNNNVNDNDWHVLSVPLEQAYHDHLVVHVPQMDHTSTSTTTTTNASRTLWQGVQAVEWLPIHRTATNLPIELRPVVTAVVSKTTATTTHRHHTTTATNTPAKQQPFPTTTSNASDQYKYILELDVRVMGPYRPEIQKALQLGRTWLHVVDQVEHVMRTHVWPMIPQQHHVYWVAVPVTVLSMGIPMTILALLVSPMVIGVSVVFFPIVLPLVIGTVLVGLVGLLALLLAMAGVYASTKVGRRHVQQWYASQSALQHAVETMTGPRFGVQTALYNTGPRPTPVTLLRTQLPHTMWKRLAVSLLIDGIGSGSYLVPGIGESFDLVWAPTQTVVIMALYQHVSPNMSYVSFAEEMLPFLDVLPSATTGWMMEFGPQLLEDAKTVNVRDMLWGNRATAAVRVQG